MGCGNNGSDFNISDFNRWLCAKLKESQKEQRICLNSYTPTFVPVDVNNPTTEEVKIWAEANLNYVQKNNGTQLVYFVDDHYLPQGPIIVYYGLGAEVTITSFIVNGDELVSTPIPVIDVDGATFIYTGQLKVLFDAWALLNGITATFDDTDLENNWVIVISDIIGDLTINWNYEFGGVLDQQQTASSLQVLVLGNGGSCDSPDFIWTLNDEEITLSNKRIFNTKTIYVDAGSGNDTIGRRGYREFPFKTLNAALVTLEDGDTLYVFPGDYFSSVTVTKYFNIYCENGVNWDLRARFNPSSGITNTTTKLNWRFDNLYGTALYPAFVGALNYINIEYNNYEYTKGLAPGFSDMNINIKTFKNAYLYLNSNDATEASKYICNININNMFVDQAPINNCPINIAQIREKTKININIDNIKIIGDLGGDNGVINLGAPGDGSPYRDIVAKINNCDFYPTAVYGTTPAPFDNRTTWRNAFPSQTGNGIFWIRQAWTNGSNINYELKNYRGTGWGAYINLWNYDVPATSPTIQRIINVKLQGYWEKSAPVSIGGWGDLTGVNQPLNTIVNIELDVICDTAPGVMFFWYGSHPSNRFNISGKIVTKSAGMPCITLNNAFNIQTPTDGNFNSNGTITLKDLMLINDGTVAPIMINPLNAQVQEVMIQNVKSNSLVVDANITEIGESITRNIKYK